MLGNAIECCVEKIHWSFSCGNGLYIFQKCICKIQKSKAKGISSHYLCQLLFESFTTGDCHDCNVSFAITVSFFIRFSDLISENEFIFKSPSTWSMTKPCINTNNWTA